MLTFPLLIGSRQRLNFPMARQVSGAWIFVEPQEYDEYQASHNSYQKMFMMQENNRGFGYLLNQQLAFADRNDWKYYAFSDDDVLGIKHRGGYHANLDHLFAQATQIMEDNNYSQLQISFAGHNWYHEGSIKEKIGAWGFLINRTSDLLSAGGYDESLPIFNDWVMSAEMIRAGFNTACWYDYMFIHKMNSQPGGASDLYKKKKIVGDAARLLQKRYGEECVRLVEAHGQIEPRFKWSKLKTEQKTAA